MTSLFSSNPIEFFKKEAKALLKAVQANDSDACSQAHEIFQDLPSLTLMKAQHIIAVKYGFKKWEELLTSTPTQLYLAITMEKIPDLTSFGIGLYSDHQKLPHAERMARFKKERDELKVNHAAVERTAKWIKENLTVIKAINSHYTSYGLKHRAEFDIGYVTNGVFIAAAVIAGVPYKIYPRSPNVSFALSTKKIKEVYERQRLATKADNSLMVHGLN